MSHFLTKNRSIVFHSGFVALLAGFVAVANGSDNDATVPSMPSGWISAYPTVVQTGTKPTLTWGINYPSVVEDYLDIENGNTLVATEKLDCEVRVLGAGVTVGSGSTYSFVPTEGRINYDGDGYERIFYGTNDDVDPDEVVWSASMKKNDTLQFGGRYYYNRSWGPWFSSSSGTLNVRTLVDGEIPPTTTPMHTAPTLESFLKPYLDSTGAVEIGPMDVIVFMELTHYDSQMSDSGYDLQDLVLLVTFKAEAKSNNGHGNNIDGIDSSNPGNAPFIDLDTDPTIDDEK